MADRCGPMMCVIRVRRGATAAARCVSYYLLAECTDLVRLPAAVVAAAQRSG